MRDVRLQIQYSCITDLPNLPLDLIFEKLNKEDDMKSFGLTCHRFLKVQNLCQKGLRIRDCFFDLDSCMLDKLLNRFCNIQDLSLVNWWKISDSALIKLQKYGSTLQCLRLYGCFITDTGIEILAKSCKSLIELNLASCRYITDCGIKYISQNCRQLRELCIRDCKKIIGVGFRGCSSNLAILDASYCALDSTGVIEILSGGGLEYLNLSWPYDKHTLGHGLATIGLGYGVNLEILSLKKCDFVEDDDVISISKGCPLLREWDLSSCTRVGLRGWESIGLSCHNLQIIHVYECGNFCDGGLLCLGNGCERLSTIYMGSCYQITSNGISAFKLQRDDVKIENSI